MINYAIIEDDKNTITMLESIVSKEFSNISSVGNAASIKGGIELLKKKQPDFIFLDINLNDGKSFEILSKFPKPTFKIIFIISYSKYAVEAFKFSALDFVLKPFSPTEIIDAVNRVIEQQNTEDYSQKIAAFFHNHTSSQKKIILSNMDSIHVVLVENILYAKSDNSYTTFFIKDNREILVSKSLKSFEEKLSAYFFFRVHQQYLINIQEIKRYDKRNDQIELLNGSLIPVAQSKKQQLLRILSN